MTKFKRVLILNRGEIAARIARTVEAMHLEPMIVYSRADKETLAVSQAREAYLLGEAPLADSYLNIPKILALAKKIGAEALHPGYGLLSENSEFARLVQQAGMVWIGPTPESMQLVSSKSKAKALAQKVGVPTLNSYMGSQDYKQFEAEAKRIGFPVLLKAAAGGGGRGIRKIENEHQLSEQFNLVKKEALSSFGNDELLLEKFLSEAHHIEVQVFGDTHGNFVHLGERDCSAQRKNQKIIEESPSPSITATQRARLTGDALKIVKASHYTNAGTVEFLVSPHGEHFFLEVNTRLQVEHPVTEQITGLDLVEWQIRVAQGEALPKRQDQIIFKGHSIEARLYAEDPSDNYRPQTGRIEKFCFPKDIRVDHFLVPRTSITPYYDSMLAKLISHATTREEALSRLKSALSQTLIAGLTTNSAYLREILNSPFFKTGKTYVRSLEGLKPHVPPQEAPTEAIALAAAIKFFDKRRKSRIHKASSWTTRDPFFSLQILNYHQKSYKLRLIPKAQVIRVEIGENHLEFSESKIESTTYLIYNDKIDLEWKGQVFTFSDPTLSLAQRAAEANQNIISSPMEGTITQVAAHEGQRAEAGEILIVIEAMKMQFELRSPYAAVVESVSVKLGSQVKAKQALIVLQPDS